MNGIYPNTVNNIVYNHSFRFCLILKKTMFIFSLFKNPAIVLNTSFIFSFQFNPATVLKVPGPISQNGDFYSNDASSAKKSWFQSSVKSVKPFGYKKRLRTLQLHIPYCVSLIIWLP